MSASATGVYVAGTARLEAGRRYGIAVRESRLEILGPTDVSPTVVLLQRPIGAIDVTTVDGRLILSESGGGSGLVLAFMSVNGTSIDGLAATIRVAAETSVNHAG